jgi:hypothetical protein
MDDRPLLLIIFLTAVLAGIWLRRRVRRPSHVPAGVARRWRWHPRTPDDCPSVGERSSNRRGLQRYLWPSRRTQ